MSSLLHMYQKEDKILPIETSSKCLQDWWNMWVKLSPLQSMHLRAHFTISGEFHLWNYNLCMGEFTTSHWLLAKLKWDYRVKVF